MIKALDNGRSRRPLAAVPSRGPRTAFVFSGGASLGAVQVGMLQALFERGITADLLVGTSVGALNAAFLASRPQTTATVTELAHVWRGLQRHHVFPMSMRAVVAGLGGKRDHLVLDHALRRLVSKHIEFADVAEAATPLHLVAFDVVGGREVLLSRGPAIDAICASAAIPGVFPPVPIGDLSLIDGGVVNNTPISHAVELGAERIYVLPTQGTAPSPWPSAAGALDAAIYGLSLLINHRLTVEVATYSRDVELILLSSPNATHVQPSDFGHSSRLIGEALDATRSLLAAGDGARRLDVAAPGPDVLPQAA
jgi:NTE family protein